MAKLHAVGYREDDVYLHCAPLFHVGGLSSMIAMLAVGATQVRRQLPHHLQLPVKACTVQPEVLKLDDVPLHTAGGQHMCVRLVMRSELRVRRGGCVILLPCCALVLRRLGGAGLPASV